MAVSPQIGPDLWKVALAFFWWRQYEDGHIEQEFDPETGQIRPWGSENPKGLKRAGWIPVTPDLAQKMQAYGEFGIPTQAPSILIDLKPGEDLIIFKDCAVIKGKRTVCKVCGLTFRTDGTPSACPKCGAKKVWRCPVCGKLQDTEMCPDCKDAAPGSLVDPFITRPDAWEVVTYNLGIKGLFLHKFDSKHLITEH